jgi:signal transduction histidine kinase
VNLEHAPVAATEPPVRTSLRLVWLVGLVYVVAAATHPSSSGVGLAAALLTTTTALGWTIWLIARHRLNLPASMAGIAVLAISGGLVVLLHPVGVLVIGLAGMCAASLLEIVPAAVVVMPGVVASVLAVVVTGHPIGVVGGAASGAVAGLAVGMGRRQSQERVRQEAELALARQRSDVEHERAEVLTERNRIAREVHDVLAHTLGALAVQMEAVGSMIADNANPTDVHHAVARSRRLVTEGLEETRRAVRVLRDEPIDVAEQLQSLADEGVAFHVVGLARPLPPATGLALVRITQEAVTNAHKHASGAPVRVILTFTAAGAELVIDNDAASASELAATGAGYGLQGMRERIELVGGTLVASPHKNGWRVRAEVPL